MLPATHPVSEEVIEPRRVENIGSHDLTRPAALELERPEAVHRPDVQTTHTLERRRPRQPQGGAAQVPTSGRHQPRLDLYRVPPVELGHPLPRDVDVHHGHPPPKRTLAVDGHRDETGRVV